MTTSGDDPVVPPSQPDRPRPVQSLSLGGANVLDYHKTEAAVTRIGSVSNVATAEMLAAILEADGIPCALQNVNSSAIQGIALYVQIHLEVPGALAARAAELLHGLFEDPDAVEPVEESAAVSPEASSEPVEEKVVVAAFDNPRSMRDAAAVLGSANVAVHLPRLAARGNRPAGTGARFVVKVDDEDADRARALLDRAGRDAEDERETDDEPRCPACSAWRVYRHTREFGNLFRRLTGRAALPDEWECLNCHHRWTEPPRDKSL